MDPLFREIIIEILDRYGNDILLDGSRFCELTEEMAPDMILECRVIKRLCQEGLLSEIHRIITSSCDRDTELANLEIKLDGAGFSKKWQQIVFEAFELRLLPARETEDTRKDTVYSENAVRSEDPQQEEQVSIETHGYSDLDEMIKEIMDRVSPDVPIIVEESMMGDTFINLVNGMNVNRGCLSPYMIQDTEKMETILEDPYILITNGTISEQGTVFKLLDMVAQTRKGLLIIASDIEKAALSAIVKQSDTVSCVAIRAPGYGDRRIEMLHDIAVVTGGSAIISDGELNLRFLSPNLFGQAAQVRVNSENTIIVDGRGSNNRIEERIEEIRYRIRTTRSEFDREKMEERLENLSRGVAMLEVGGKTLQEMKDRVKYAEKAVKRISQ